MAKAQIGSPKHLSLRNATPLTVADSARPESAHCGGVKVFRLAHFLSLRAGVGRPMVKGDVMARSISLAVMLASTSLVWSGTAGYSAPLFFRRHGTAETTHFDEEPEYHRPSLDWTTTLMIDLDRGAVEGPGGGSNEYCTREPDWLPVGTYGVIRKIIKECTTLQVSETLYSFNTTSEIPNRVPAEQSAPEFAIQRWAEGRLDRTTGEFSATERVKDANANNVTGTEKMTCVPAERKF